MGEKMRIALIGAGGMANAVHYPSLAEFDDVELVGVCDVIENKLHQTADRFAIERRFADYKKMIEATAPHAVYALMPPHHLWDVVLHCLQAKLDVFIEKSSRPFRAAGPHAGADQTVGARGGEEGLRDNVRFNRRFIPLMTECRRRVDERGPMVQCVASFYKCHQGGPYYGGATDILTCDAIHAVDALRWMAAGEAKVVRSSVRAIDATFDNSFNALVEFDTGCVGS